MHLPRELGFWLAVALVAVVGVAGFKLIAAHLGSTVPALADLAAFI
jgi:UPF0716 family protein affecting phage T7 exclusion